MGAWHWSFSRSHRSANMRGMRWLLHGQMTAAVAAALKRHEHHVHELSEVELKADAPAAEILKAASKKQWEIITTDPVLAEAPFKDHAFGRTIVFLQLGGGDVEQDDAIDRLFERYK